MAHAAHFCPDVKRKGTGPQLHTIPGMAQINEGTRQSVDGGPGVVIGLGADDVPADARGPGTDYLLNKVLWQLRDPGFERQAWSGEKFACPSCNKSMRQRNFN